MFKSFRAGVLLLALVVSSTCLAPLQAGDLRYQQLAQSIPEASFLEPDGSISHCTAFAVRIHQYLTAAHCVKDVVGVVVGEEQAEILKVDENVDLALLSTMSVEGAKTVPVLDIATAEPQVGTEVVSLGYPGQFVTPVTFFGKVMGGQVKDGDFAGLMFVDGSGARGMSGGPVIRTDSGKVVGVIRGGAAFVPTHDIMMYAAGVKQIRAFLK